MTAVHPVAYIRRVLSELPLAKEFVICESNSFGESQVKARVLRGRTVFCDPTNPKNAATVVLEVDSAADHYVACMIIASDNIEDTCPELQKLWANSYTGVPYKLVVIVYPNQTQSDDWVGRYKVMTATDYRRFISDYTVAAVSAMADHLNAI